MKRSHAKQGERALASFRAASWTALLLLLAACVGAHGFDLAPAPSRAPSRTDELWLFLPLGYLLTVAVETPVLLVGLPKRLSFRERFFAGLWLTACTYPVVVLVLPVLLEPLGYGLYLLVAETFAPAAECALLWSAFRARLGPGARTWARAFAAVVVANLLSFAAGVLLQAFGLLG